MFSNQALKRLIIPLVIEQLLVVLVGMADTAMVSFAGESAVSGVALVDMVNFFIITVFTALATGGAVIVSQYVGSGQRNEANHSASQLFTIAALFSVAVMILCLAFRRGILRLLFGSIAPDVMQAAVVYLTVTACSFPFIGLYGAAAALFRSMQRTRTTMYVSLLANCINVAGNAIGVFVLRAGVLGVAIPTLIARIVSAAIMVALAFRRENPVFVRPRDIFRWDGPVVRRILRIAVPNGIENGLFALGKVLVVSIVALFGTSQIAASGVSNGIGVLAIAVVSANNLSMITVVGQCVGAGEYAQAEYYTRKIMKVSYIATAVLTLLIAALLPLILRCYTLSDETRRLCYILINMHNFVAILLHPTSFNLGNTLRAAGDVRYTMVAGVSSMLLFRVGCAVLFGVVLGLGVIGVWIGMCLDWLARSIAFLARYKSGKWKAFRAI